MTRVRSRAFATLVHCYTSTGPRMTEECESMARGPLSVARHRHRSVWSACARRPNVNTRAMLTALTPWIRQSRAAHGCRSTSGVTGGHAGGQWQGRQAPRSHGVTNGSDGSEPLARPMRASHPTPAARAIRTSPVPTTPAPMARATRSPAGARRSAVMAADTMAMARRSMTPITRRSAVRAAQL